MNAPSTRTDDVTEIVHAESSPNADATRSSAKNAWQLVAMREIVVRAKSKAFIISTILTVVFLAGLAAFSIVQSNKETKYVVAVTNEAGSALVAKSAPAAKAFGDNTEVSSVLKPDDAAASKAVIDGDADGWLKPSADGSWTLAMTSDGNASLKSIMDTTVRNEVLASNAASAGTTVEALTKGATLATETLNQGGVNPAVIQVATIAFALLFYMAAMMFGMQIASSVVEEKQSRIIEIIATAIPVRQLLAGKVLGNSVIAFGQMVIYAAVALIALSFTSFSSLLPLLSQAVIWFVLFFAVGFLALASLYAVAGALASRVEDLQSTTGPVTVVMIAVYFVSFGLSGTAKVVASYIPITSVITMPSRVLAGTAQWWEPIVSLLIMIAFAAVCILVGEKVYRRSLMQTRGKLSWKQALRTEV